MSQSDNAQKYEYLNAISTEQLRELLELEISSDRDNDELVLHILGVIKERNKQNGEASNVSWQQARADFDKYYNTPDGKGRSLYPTDIGQKKVPTKKSPGKVVRWIATVAAALVLVIFVVPSALGDADVWDMVARWTDNVLQTKHSEASKEVIEPLQAEIDGGFSSVQDALTSYQITTAVVPTLYPNGFAFESITIRERPEANEILFYATFRNDAAAPLVLSITKRSSLNTRTYEKNANFLEEYIVGNVTHIIFSNTRNLSVIWYVEDLECSITANISIDEMKDMIKSIYER